MHKSMKRKTLQLSDYNRCIYNTDKRTTLYLPESIIISDPTKTINEKLNALNKLLDLYNKDQFYNHEVFYELYRQIQNVSKTTSYQIVIKGNHIKYPHMLKKKTGLTYGLTHLFET